MEAVLQTAVLSNATAAELHYLLACTSLSFAALTPNTHQMDRRSRCDSTICWTVQVLYHPTQFISIRLVLPFSNRLFNGGTSEMRARDLLNANQSLY